MPTDLFGRTTAFGLGSDGTFVWTWTDRDSSWNEASSSTFYVDGSQVVMPVGQKADSYFLDGPALPKKATLSFDIYFPALDPTDWLPMISFNVMWSDLRESPGGYWLNMPGGLRQDPDYPNTDPHVFFGARYPSSNNSWLFHFDNTPARLSVAIDAGNWYTFKMGWDADNLLVGYKLWKRSDPEPEEWMLRWDPDKYWVDWSWFDDGNDGKPWLDIYSSGTDGSLLDNFTIGDFEAIGYPVTSRASIVPRSTPRPTDTFTRTVTVGLGDDYGFLPSTAAGGALLVSTFNDPASDPVSVDGTRAVIPGSVTTDVHSAYTLSGLRQAVGYLEFDFYIPASPPTWAASRPEIRVVINRGRTYGVGIVVRSGGTSTWTVGVTNGSGSAFGNFGFAPPATNAWYTAKLSYDDTQFGVGALVKRQGFADSAAVREASISFGSGGLSAANQTVGDRIILRAGTNGSTTYLDNLSWLGVSLAADAYILGFPGITADAFLRALRSGSLTANARVDPVPFKADATILRIQLRQLAADALLLSQYFRADAFIDDLELWRHHRYHDHTGTLSDTQLLIEEAIGAQAAGTSLRKVLERLWTWAAGKS